MAWIKLFLAGLVEVAWLYTMKQSLGFTRWGWSAITAVLMIISFALLSSAMKHIPAGTAYAVWTGTGAVGAALLGIFFFNEPRDWLRITSICLIVAGIVGLKLASH